MAASCGRVTTTPDSGTGTTESFGAGQRSGTRLKLKYFGFEGARQIVEIYDSARQDRCAFVRWSDGNFYCAPYGEGREVVFSDDNCTTKIGLGSTAPCSSYRSFVESTSDCNGVSYTHVYPAAGVLPLDQYFVLDTGICRKVSGSGRPLYALGPEVVAADLVRGTIAPEGSGRIQARFVTATDGLRVSMAPAFDSLLGVDCYLRQSGQCIPISTGSTSDFKDPTCTTRAALIDNRCPRRAIAEPATCGYRSLGSQIQSNFNYINTGTGCRQVSLPANHTLFDIGPQVTLSTQSRAPIDNGRRIRPVRFTDLDMSADIQMYDVDKQSECSPAVIAGSVYCFPNGASVSTRYTAPDCAAASAVDVVEVNANICTSTPISKFAVKYSRDNNTCTESGESRPVGAIHREQLYEKITGSCVPASATSTYYDVGAPLPLSELARGALLVDQ